MTLYSGFDAFYLESVEGMTFWTDDSDVITIDGNEVTYSGPGTATVTVLLNNNEVGEFRITVLNRTSGITIPGSEISPVVNIPTEDEKEAYVSKILDRTRGVIPSSVVLSATIVDISAYDENGEPLSENVKLCIPYSMFGSGSNYGNYSMFEFYVVHLKDGSAIIESIDGYSRDGVIITVSGFSPFMLGIEKTFVPPAWEDDDPFIMPIIGTTDDHEETVKIVACAAAAVAAALMAAFLVMDHRR